MLGGVSCLAAVVALSGPVPRGSPERGHTAAASRADDDRTHVREVVVRTRPKRVINWGTLDDPRVQAFFRSTSPIGPSMFDWEHPPLGPPRPLVRVGVARSWTRGEARDRRLARRLARAAVDDSHAELYACYVEALGRDLMLTSRVMLTVHVSVRGEIEDLRVIDGALVDDRGNACVVDAVGTSRPSGPRVSSAQVVQVPIWFWIQNQAAPETIMAARRDWLRDLRAHVR